MTSKDQGLAGDLAAREREHFERAYAVYLPVTTRVTPDNFQRDEDGDEYVHTIVQVAWSIWCAARALATPVATPNAYLCPAGCGCVWRDNRDGSMSLMSGGEKACSVCEFLPLTKLTKMDVADHLFIEARGDGVWLVCLGKVHSTMEEAQRECRAWQRATATVATTATREPTDATENAKLPPSELVWLFSHCKAIGMARKSDSGQWEHDIALFTVDLKAENAKLLEALEDAWTRMDRARNILTNGKPTRECNWGMLDTTLDRAALAASKEQQR